MSSPFDLLIPKVPESRESWFWATVTAVGPLRLTRDGDTAAMPYIPETLVPVSSLSVGQRVRCQLYNRTLFIIGAAGGGQSGFGDPIVITDWDDAGQSGVYYSEPPSATNSPPIDGGYFGIVFRSPDGQWINQILSRTSNANPDMFTRSSGDVGATWSSWLTVFSDTGWIDATMASGFSAVNSDNKFQYRTIGSIGYTRGALNGGSLSANTIYSKISSVPSDIAPERARIIAIGASSGKFTATARVETNGDVGIRTGEATASYYGIDLDWPIG